VPAFYNVEYNDSGKISLFAPIENAPFPIEKRIIEDFDKVFYPENFIVPYTETVHDRAVLEVLRGCVRGCRFCQAGFIYRPFREKNFDTLNKQGKALCDSTGYDEISLSSLSTSDYSQLEKLLEDMMDWTEKEKVNLSLPSLRIDNFPQELIEKISAVRKSGLTFAPEAGTQRLRDAINKNITEQDIMQTVKTAFEGGYTAVKLYFMIGLPTETMEDIKGIYDTAQRVVDLYYSLPNKPKGKGVTVSVTVSSFVPKAFTPFQFESQNTKAELEEKQKYLKSIASSRKISISYHGSETSFLEGVFARGDRRLGKLLYTAWKKGCKLDSWSECFNYQKWLEAFQEINFDPEFFANRKRDYEEILPWDIMDFGISKNFLIKENKLSHCSQTTENCKEKCSGCGANKLVGGECFANK
ncbi:MAG: TIGR03960 family B12-binding radical SAM protein, partial [Oscillospiraceae bacterium]